MSSMSKFFSKFSLKMNFNSNPILLIWEGGISPGGNNFLIVRNGDCPSECSYLSKRSFLANDIFTAIITLIL